MKLLLDTHIAFWLMFETDELTVGERAIIAVQNADIAVSVVSLWELRLKWQRRFTSGARKGPAETTNMLSALKRAEIAVLDLTPSVCVASLEPPLDHSDPFDLLLLTQAQQGGYRLFTRDRKLATHPVALAA